MKQQWFLKKPLPQTSSTELVPLILSGSSSSGSGSTIQQPHCHHHETTPFSVQQQLQQYDYNSTKATITTTPTTTHSASLQRHLTLLDLIVIGLGVTIGSGLFVLCGLIAHEYAGPASALSWLLSGTASLLSGCCYAELSARIPRTGSAYAYAYVALGELPAVVAAACLSLDYIVAGAAVARSWGDKCQAWWVENARSSSIDDGMHTIAAASASWSPFAFCISSISVLLLLAGVKESKAVTHCMTFLKVSLVAVMMTGGIWYLQAAAPPSNWIPFAPFGLSGVARGATATFFGYLGYDEIALLGGEAIEPKKNLPRAILGTLTGITLIYVLAALVLTGMLPYEDISSVSGFPDAFRQRGAPVLAQITALGEIVTLPIVVLLTVMCQPRLQYALARDGLLPPIFGKVDARGNLFQGTWMAGILIVTIATLVPFEHLNDMISCAVLTSLSLTDTSLIVLWHPSPPATHPYGGARGLSPSSYRVETILCLFHILSLGTCVVGSHFIDTSWGKVTTVVGTLVLLWCVGSIIYTCPRSPTFGGIGPLGVTTSAPDNSADEDSSYFRTPLVPWVPCLAIFLNWYLIAQLQLVGIGLHLLFLSLAVLYYILYASHHSIGNKNGWQGRGQEHFHHEHQ